MPSSSGTQYRLMETTNFIFVRTWKNIWFYLCTFWCICVSWFAGVYKPEPMRDMWWALLSNGIMFLYHFVFLQLLGLVRWRPLLAAPRYINILSLTSTFSFPDRIISVRFEVRKQIFMTVPCSFDCNLTLINNMHMHVNSPCHHLISPPFHIRNYYKERYNHSQSHVQ